MSPAVDLSAPLRPRPHQEKATRAAADELVVKPRAQAVMACGSGKTLIGTELMQQLESGRVLVVVPTLDLLSQTAAAYARQRAGDLVAVCSDSEVLDDAAGVEDVTRAVTGLRGRVTTRPARLAEWLDTATSALIVLVTYASLPVIAAAHRDHQAPAWDLVVIDEAHRSAGRTDRAWNQVHDNKAIPAQRRFYMTATPKVMNSERYESISMDSEAVFGREVYRLSFAEAIELGLICDYRVVVSVVTDQDVAAFTAERGRVLDVEEQPVPAKMVAAQIALLKACQEFGLRRVISYHHRVLAATTFATTLPRTQRFLAESGVPCPPVDAEWVSGEQNPADRRAILRSLAEPGERARLVANARVLTEGVDVPDLDAVLFADARSSPTEVVQATSRALRLGTDPDKIATIIIPVLATAAENPISALEDSAFEPVWQTVRALRSHDERLADWLDEARVRVTHEDTHMPNRLHDLPHWLLLRGTPVTPEFAAAIATRVVETATSPWWETYALAARFYADHGHLLPGSDHPRLRTFVSNNRQAAAQRRLEPERRAALDRIGMVYDLQARQEAERWDDLLCACRVYHAQHGNLAVKQTFRLVDDRFPAPGFPLGSRINSVRSNPDTVPDTVRKQLDDWGMLWNVLDAAFTELLVHTRHWTAAHPATPPPTSEICCGYYPLGQRLKVKRTAATRSRLPKAQRDALEELGVLSSRQAVRREMFLAACDRWLAERAAAGVPQPCLDVPVTYIDSTGYNLGDAIAHQRALRAGSKRGRNGRRQAIDPDLAAELDRRGMIWTAVPARREVTSAELDRIRALSGRAQTEAIIALVEQDVTQSSIADALGMKRATLCQRIKYAKAHPTPATRPINEQEADRLRSLTGDEQTRAVIALVDQGVTRTSIAPVLGIHKSSLGERITTLLRRSSPRSPARPPHLTPTKESGAVGQALTFTAPESPAASPTRSGTAPAVVFRAP